MGVCPVLSTLRFDSDGWYWSLVPLEILDEISFCGTSGLGLRDGLSFHGSTIKRRAFNFTRV